MIIALSTMVIALSVVILGVFLEIRTSGVASFYEDNLIVLAVEIITFFGIMLFGVVCLGIGLRRLGKKQKGD